MASLLTPICPILFKTGAVLKLKLRNGFLPASTCWSGCSLVLATLTLLHIVTCKQINSQKNTLIFTFSVKHRHSLTLLSVSSDKVKPFPRWGMIIYNIIQTNFKWFDISKASKLMYRMHSSEKQANNFKTFAQSTITLYSSATTNAKPKTTLAKPWRQSQ